MVPCLLSLGTSVGCFPKIPDPAEDEPAAKGCGLTGTVLYVDAAAEAGGDGSESTPFQVLDDALAELAPGVSICIRAGTYAGEFALDTNGTAQAPVVVAGFPGEDVILEAEAGKSVAHVLGIGGSYTTVRNLTVQGGDGGLLVYQTDHATVTRVRSRYNRRIGFNVQSASDVIVEDCLAHDNVTVGVSDTGIGFNATGTNVLLRRNVAHNNLHRGYHLSTGTTLENCVAFDNGTALDKPSGTTQTGVGIGFYAGKGVRIVRSIGFDNSSSAFRSSGGSDGGWDNCTALRNQFSYSFETASTTNFAIRNCLSVDGSLNLPDPPALPQSSNSWQAGIGGDVVISTKPPDPAELWQATGSPWTPFEESDFLKPKPGSAIIDAGEVIPDRPSDYEGSAPDLGAFEAN
ncbi:MAG: right-handed parallel beta-helix repeat-containing protein [Polyangiaceae bacterium]